MSTNLAHPGHIDAVLEGRALQEWHGHQLAARACAQKLSLNRKRDNSTVSTTCALTPELEEGPYFILDEYVRNDLRENAVGVDLFLNIKLVDSTNCEPVTDALVEIWAANATGFYSGYSGSGDGGPSSGTGLTDNKTYLRGGNVVDSNGEITLVTKFCSYYTGRTIHIHTVVHENYEINSNGTIATLAGTIAHVGQIFFEEDVITSVLATSDYQNNPHTRTYNSDDRLFNQLTGAGYNPYAAVTGNVTTGLTATVTIVIDRSAKYAVTNANYVTASPASNTASNAYSTGTSSRTSQTGSSTAQDADAASTSGVTSSARRRQLLWL